MVRAFHDTAENSHHLFHCGIKEFAITTVPHSAMAFLPVVATIMAKSLLFQASDRKVGATESLVGGADCDGQPGRFREQ